MNVWTQLFFLPVTALVYGLDFMVRTLQAVQQSVQQIAIAIPNTGWPPGGGQLGRSTPIGGAPRGDAATTLKETREMSNNCSCNDCGQPFCEVRVYEYYIVSVKPGAEQMLQGVRSEVITSDMSGEAFSNYVIILYCQKHKIPPSDAKYIRVCYRINCTFPKEREDCCRDTVNVLKEIRDALGGRPRRDEAEESATSAPPATLQNANTGTSASV